MREFYQSLSGKMNRQSALSITIVHADQHLLTRKNYQSFLLQTVIRVLKKLSQGNEISSSSQPLYISCKREKYKPKLSTREKTRSCMEFRADDRVRKSANLHVQMCTEMYDVAQEVLGLCLKAATCYKNFVRVIYQSK